MTAGNTEEKPLSQDNQTQMEKLLSTMNDVLTKTIEAQNVALRIGGEAIDLAKKELVARGEKALNYHTNLGNLLAIMDALEARNIFGEDAKKVIQLAREAFVS